MGTIYLIHFDNPISDQHTAQHYIGYSTKAPYHRLEAHRNNRGARLTQVANDRNIGYDIVRCWHGNKADERYLKRLKCGPKLCPVCNDKVYGIKKLKNKKWLSN